MKLAAIKLVDLGQGPFVIFEQKDGSYATAAYDNQRAVALADCFLYQKQDGQYIVGPQYSSSNAIDSL